jgi:hypothetical protein|eukprot:COSAG03_NODE_224_length_10342_cov_27.072342_10_plen_73_part_00
MLSVHSCVFTRAQNYKILPLDLRDEYRKLATDEKLRFVIYNGQSDANVPYNGQVQVGQPFFIIAIDPSLEPY